ncbi:TonB-dependent receptor domain-containing protein [Spongorhabdus nitratireducens]
MQLANSYSVRALTLAIASITAGAAIAATEEDKLDTIIVTASRTAQTVEQALAPVTVITREDIATSQAQDIPELLERAPGIQVTRNGGPGAIASVFVRGASSSQTLVLVDGVRVNSAAAGGAALQYLTPEQIERIEIVRGPHSSLYGADAIGGVIQIFTRKGEGKPKLSITVGGGSRGTSNYALNYGGKTGNTRFNFGASLYETEGFDITPEKINMQGDKDAYRNKSLSMSLTHQFDNDIEVGFNAMNAEGKVEFDNLSSFGPPANNAPYTNFKNSSAGAYISLPVNDIWQTRLETGWMRDYGYQRIKDAQGNHKATSHYRTWRNTVTWQNDIAWSDNQLTTAGLEYYKDRADNSSPYKNNNKPVDSRSNKAVFVQNQSYFDGHDLQVGLRYDDNEEYGHKTTGNIAWGIDLPASLRLVTSYGTAFRAPTFNDLYFPGANPKLKPEESENYEVALKGRHSFGNWSVAAFQNNIDDMIRWAPQSNGIWTPLNVDKARIRGIEAQLDTVLAGWQLNTTVTLLDPEDRKTGKQLVKRAKQMLTLNADRQYGDFSIGGTLKAQSKTYNDTANKQQLGGFGTVDLRTGYRFSSSFKGQLKVVNLFDKDYHTTKGYNSEPRGVFVSVTYTPEI